MNGFPNSIDGGVDSRNVINRYKGWSNWQIVDDVKTQQFPYAVCMVNFTQDYNYASLLRNANAFGAKEVFYVSETKKFDPRGAVGVQHVTTSTHIPDYPTLYMLKNKYTFVAIEQDSRAVNLARFVWPKNPLMLFGAEGCGLDPEVIFNCEHVVYIPQYGSVRSINVSSCSAVLMVDYVRKYNSFWWNIATSLFSMWR